MSDEISDEVSDEVSDEMSDEMSDEGGRRLTGSRFRPGNCQNRFRRPGAKLHGPGVLVEKHQGRGNGPKGGAFQPPAGPKDRTIGNSQGKGHSMAAIVTHARIIAGIASGLLLVSGFVGATEQITVRSGNGAVGQPDGAVTFLVGPSNGAFGAAFGPADFLAARTGAPARIITNHGAWTPGLLADSQARWISNSANGVAEGATALYAVPFTVTAAQPGAASLVLDFSVDNVLGTGPNVGVYLNEQPLAGTTGGWYTSAHQFVLDVTGLLLPGENWLYINGVDQGGPAGLLFSALFTVESAAAAGTADRPSGMTLEPNWPNPFNPVTTIAFTLPETAVARLSVYNLAGTRVATLVDGLTGAGFHQASFDASNLASGVYFYTLEAAGLHETRKMILQK
jgi:hypothetical protein